MEDEEEKRLHSAGATGRHSSPFAALEVPARRESPSREIIEKWIRPFYMVNLWNESSTFVEAVRQAGPDLSEAVVADLLSYFNWRPRLVGAYLVAAKRYVALEEQIGRLL